MIFKGLGDPCGGVAEPAEKNTDRPTQGVSLKSAEAENAFHSFDSPQSDTRFAILNSFIYVVSDTAAAVFDI